MPYIQTIINKYAGKGIVNTFGEMHYSKTDIASIIVNKLEKDNFVLYLYIYKTKIGMYYSIECPPYLSITSTKHIKHLLKEIKKAKLFPSNIEKYMYRLIKNTMYAMLKQFKLFA